MLTVTRKFSIILCSCLLLAVHLANADELVVKDKSGATTVFALQDLRKITFPDTQVKFTKTDASETVFVIDNLYSISFNENSDTGFPVLQTNNNKLNVYPIPATDELHCSIGFEAYKPFILRISDIEGRILTQKQNMGMNEANVITIPVSALPNGVYFLCLQSESLTRTAKFIVNR
jgi:hypothetical protein